MPSREEIMAELSRRGKTPPREAILAEMQRRGISAPQQANNQPSFDQTVQNIQNETDPNSILEKLGVSPLKTNPYKLTDYLNVADTGDTFKNAWEDLFRREGIHGGNREFAKIFGHGGHQQKTQEAYEKALETHPEETQLGANLARGYSSIPFFMAAGTTPALQGLNPALQNIAAAGIGGGALGGLETPYGEETRMGNAINEAKQDALGATLFEGLRLGGKVLNGQTKLPKLPKFLSQKEVGAEIGGDAKALSKELGAVYEEVKTASKKAKINADTTRSVTETTGILDPQTGKPITKTFKRVPVLQEISAELPGVPKEVQRNVHAALETGDIEQLIDAEKMLGKTKHKAWLDDKRGLKALDQDSYDAMTNMENKINDYIADALNKQEPTLADKLFAARNKYHTELGPYLDVPAIREYMHGNLKEKDLVRLLQSNTKSGTQFRAKLADKYKDVGRNKFKNDLAKMGLKGSRIAEILLLVGKI
jgi:hypothetical protein